jgi:hypothetical protein
MQKYVIAFVFSIFTAYIPVQVQAQAEETSRHSYAEIIAPLKNDKGFFDIYRDAEHGKLLLSVSTLNEPFLLISSMPYGLGSNDVGIDRGAVGETKIVHFEKHGARMFLVQENTHFIGSSANPDERRSVTEAFAAAVLWAGDILAQNGDACLIDFSGFLTADHYGVADKLIAAKQGQYQIDEKRSAVLVENAKNFPDNTELEAMLTFSGPGTGEFVRDVAASPTSLLLHQHISMVRAPAPGYKPRLYHPGSGGYSTDMLDFSTPLGQGLDLHYQIRHRLEKTDPTAAFGTVKKPIVYYVDRGAPEPIRSALLEGASWWKTAFEKAGFKNAYRVELLPEGADPTDVRYNVIQWVHRSTRGWSYGNSISDPRTGEIIKGSVTLGSQRIRQDMMIAESLLAPYGKGGDPERKKLAEQVALDRIRQLAAHEVGHTLGFTHNFSASRFGNGSVMDYPHPILGLNAAGAIDLDHAYYKGVGAWDDFIVQHAYSEFSQNEEAAGLAKLRAQASAQHLSYITDSDSRSPGSLNPDGLLWDFGPDSLQTYDQILKVRRQALDNFSLDVLPDERQLGEFEARLVPVYLLHRYQLEAVARLLAGASYQYGLAGDVRSGTAKAGMTPVSAATQRQALKRLTESLTAEQLGLPKQVLDLVTPQGAEYSRTPEYFGSRMNVAFDALSVVEAGAAQTCTFLFDAERMNRIAWQHARAPEQPGVEEVLDAVLNSSWKRQELPSKIAAADAVQSAANWVILNAMLGLIDNGDVHPAVRAELRESAEKLQHWLTSHQGKGANVASRKQGADLIRHFLNDAHSVKLAPMPSIPPGAPI